MIELIAIIIFLTSLLGMLLIFFRKIPVLLELPEIPSQFSLRNNFLKLKEKIGIFNPLRYFSSDIILQKILSKIRILALRLEKKIGDWLQLLREKSQRKIRGNDNYWRELKEITKKRESQR